MVRSARLTSTTTESWSRIRVRLQSQAQRSTVFEAMGSENSASAPGAPVRSSKVSIELGPSLECVANSVRGPRHHGQMGEADVAVLHGEPALWHLRDPLPDRDPVGGRVGGHVTVEADPVDRAVGTLVLPVLGLFELGRELRKLELQVVDVSTQLDEA